jgi:hypothetical protein
MVVEYAKERWRVELTLNCRNSRFGNSLNRRSHDMAWDLEMLGQWTILPTITNAILRKYQIYSILPTMENYSFPIE